MSAHNLPYQAFQAPWTMADPGAAGTITVSKWNAYCPVVTAAAEARTLAQPAKAGILATVCLDTDGGDLTLTVTGGYNEDADTSITFDTAGNYVVFFSIKVGASYYWRAIAQEGTNASVEEGTFDTITATTGAITTVNSTTVNATNIDAGASGTAGSVDVFPATAAKGKFTLSCTDQDGDTTVTLKPAAMGQASVISIPDPGAATANVMLTDQANDGAPITASSAELNVMDGVTAGTSAASKGVVLDAEQQLNSIGVIRSVDKIVSTAEVKALNGTPITVLSAVGAGYSAVFLGAYVLLDYVSAGYAADAGEDLVFQQLSGGAEVSQSLDGTLFTGTADAIVWAGPKGADAGTTQTLVDNGGFEVTIQSGEWITGDSPLKIRLYYRLVKKSELEAIA